MQTQSTFLLESGRLRYPGVWELSEAEMAGPSHRLAIVGIFSRGDGLKTAAPVRPDFLRATSQEFWGYSPLYEQLPRG